MANSGVRKEPPCPFDQERFKGCLAWVNGELTYYINRRCRARLRWLFWFNYAESPYYADPRLENDYYETLTSRQDWVEYSETIIIPDEDVPRREREYPLGYRRLAHRLDFYVTRSGFLEALRRMGGLGRSRGSGPVMETRIFGSVRVLLLDDVRFGERPAQGVQVHWHPSDAIRSGPPVGSVGGPDTKPELPAA